MEIFEAILIYASCHFGSEQFQKKKGLGRAIILFGGFLSRLMTVSKLVSVAYRVVFEQVCHD
jgi:hypothetical protein